MPKPLFTLLLSVFIVPMQANSQVIAIPNDPNWDRVLNEEFTGTTLNSSIWEIRDNFDHYGSDQVLCIFTDRPENHSVDNGVLSLIAQEEQSPYVHDGNSYDYTSAWIESIDDWKYGYIEIKSRMDGGQGIGPAFWLFQGNCDGQDGFQEELDIFEIDGSSKTETRSNYHYWHPTNNCKDIGHDIGYHACPDWSTNWNTYAVEWNPDSIKYFTNREIVRSFKNDFSYQESLDIKLNLSVRSCITYAGCPDKNTSFPSVMEIDYVNVYQLNMDCSTIVYQIGDFNSFDYAVKKAYELDDSTVVPTNANIIFRATDYFELDDGFTIPNSSTVTFVPTNCY